MCLYSQIHSLNLELNISTGLVGGQSAPGIFLSSHPLVLLGLRAHPAKNGFYMGVGGYKFQSSFFNRKPFTTVTLSSLITITSNTESHARTVLCPQPDLGIFSSYLNQSGGGFYCWHLAVRSQGWCSISTMHKIAFCPYLLSPSSAEVEKCSTLWRT